ncbi:MAG: arsenite-activated ATPase ArsA [Acidobacteria bacterium]|nr:arsenite-activated ATPase ArsA [Acidobacteriota bacterium]
MRILLFSGKGGVGKTSLAAATGVRLASLGYRTLVMSVDPAHSLADSFDFGSDLFTRRTADPCRLDERLYIQEVNIQAEIKRHWREVSSYVMSVLRTTGLTDVEAEELAILPGMEELSAMMYVNQYRREGRYDVVVLDCAPTAESLRFISMPTTLEWYMKHIFPVQRTVMKAVRPIANKVAPVELPPDSYFANVRQLFDRLSGVEHLLEDPSVTSVRLVTNPERVVLRETQRAFVYFSLHGLTVDTIIVNRVLPPDAAVGYFKEWQHTQDQVNKEIEDYFSPIPVRKVPLFRDEVLGRARLEEVAQALYGPDEDPSALVRTERPYTFEKRPDGRYQVKIALPFATKAEVELFKKGDELVVEVGTLRRHIGLPTSMAALKPTRARLDHGTLTVILEDSHE